MVICLMGVEDLITAMLSSDFNYEGVEKERLEIVMKSISFLLLAPPPPPPLQRRKGHELLWLPEESPFAQVSM